MTDKPEDLPELPEEEPLEDSPLVIRSENGKSLPVHWCTCGTCHNEWYVPGLSDDWMPNFCPYCGVTLRIHIETTTKLGPKN